VDSCVLTENLCQVVYLEMAQNNGEKTQVFGLLNWLSPIVNKQKNPSIGGS
jgi:hypothetical protein